MPRGTNEAPAPSQVLKPQGKDTKRTPQSSFDTAAGKDVYEPEKVVAQRTAKGVLQFQVKWVGYDAKSNTWEPLENLAGCEDLVADFKAREMQRQKEMDMVAAENQREKQAAAEKEAAAAAVAAAAARVAAQAAGTPTATVPPVCQPATEPTVKVEGKRRTAAIWTAFDKTVRRWDSNRNPNPLDRFLC